MSENKTREMAKVAFSAVYNSDPAEFNRIAQEAIKDAVKSKIQTMRGEIRDQVTNTLLVKDSGTTITQPSKE
jgi:NAD(P)H-hydrate repair Nnr-like enzyme with NAD(P)H-hydrate dehydratase domain